VVVLRQQFAVGGDVRLCRQAEPAASIGLAASEAVMDVLVACATKNEATVAGGHGAFCGVLDPDGLTVPERTVRRLPAGRALSPEGELRDWEDIHASAGAIAGQMSRPQPADRESDSHVPI
jgi:hypothetical protein